MCRYKGVCRLVPSTVWYASRSHYSKSNLDLHPSPPYSAVSTSAPPNPAHTPSSSRTHPPSPPPQSLPPSLPPSLCIIHSTHSPLIMGQALFRSCFLPPEATVAVVPVVVVVSMVAASSIACILCDAFDAACLVCVELGGQVLHSRS